MGILELIFPAKAKGRISKERYKQIIKTLPGEIPFPETSQFMIQTNKENYEKIYGKLLPFKGLTYEDLKKLQKEIIRRGENYKIKKEKKQEKELEKIKRNQKFKEELKEILENVDQKLLALKYESLRVSIKELYKLKKDLKEDLNYLKKKYKPDYKENENIIKYEFGDRVRELKNYIKALEKRREEEEWAEDTYKIAKKILEKGIKGKPLYDAINSYLKVRNAGINLKLSIPPPKKLYHQVSEFRGEEISGRGKIKKMEILKPEEYVRRVKTILDEGLRPSFRTDQVVSDERIQANYFLNKPNLVYGPIALEINTDKFGKEIFENNAIGFMKKFYDKEYMIYSLPGKALKTDFKVILNSSGKGVEEKQLEGYETYLRKIGISSYKEYIDELKKELKKAKIPFEEV